MQNSVPTALCEYRNIDSWNISLHWILSLTWKSVHDLASTYLYSLFADHVPHQFHILSSTLCYTLSLLAKRKLEAKLHANALLKGTEAWQKMLPQNMILWHKDFWSKDTCKIAGGIRTLRPPLFPPKSRRSNSQIKDVLLIPENITFLSLREIYKNKPC